MSEDAERIKELVAFKKRIESRIGEMESELRELQAALETVNSLLLDKGFKRAEIVAKHGVGGAQPAEREEMVEREASITQAALESESAGTLKSVAGDVLAELYVDGNSLHVVLAEDKNFDINTPPFSQFLLQRILLKMQERDGELVRSGQLDPDKILCFDIVRDGDFVREIVIKNFDSDRLRELKSSIRWTLEKMCEKTKG